MSAAWASIAPNIHLVSADTRFSKSSLVAKLAKSAFVAISARIVRTSTTIG